VRNGSWIRSGRKIRIRYRDEQSRQTERTIWLAMVGYAKTVRLQSVLPKSYRRLRPSEHLVLKEISAQSVQSIMGATEIRLSILACMSRSIHDPTAVLYGLKRSSKAALAVLGCRREKSPFSISEIFVGIQTLSGVRQFAPGSTATAGSLPLRA
jgi:hypothetical protein